MIKSMLGPSLFVVFVLLGGDVLAGFAQICGLNLPLLAGQALAFVLGITAMVCRLQFKSSKRHAGGGQ